MTDTEIKEIDDRIANLRSSQKDLGCERCDKGVVYVETENWGIVFKKCPHCSEEASE
ncbi:hypothetical protein [Trichococcus collinsii]|uniref:Uncharacterized protein n=1 Tax=Trichococcus collinsii TaxID=157076 RepID=A0AB37ZXF9_9LACT|nr:hypothetical protein [Trichococcus collinsii]CZR02733.1 Hypothetical protein Tcol_2073 [Trichococcus collinsii]SDZ96425.1 hypothetical protein SAMN04488525_101737 [Trichococcus collinsii]